MPHTQKCQPKRLAEQVVVLTGATTPVGLSTALEFAERGAKLVLAGQNENDLREAVCQIRQKGGDASYVCGDVADIDAVEKIAAKAIAEFGRVDTWINNENMSIAGKLMEVSMREKRRLFDVNFWGVVHGSRSAVKLMQTSGGVIVNVCTAPSDPTLPIQGLCLATNHAVKSYSDALHTELLTEGYPIFVSLLLHEDSASESVLVAKAILQCCEKPERNIYVGSSAKLFSAIESLFPKLAEYLALKTKSDEIHPGKSAVVAASLGVAAYAAYKAYQNSRRPGEAAH